MIWRELVRIEEALSNAVDNGYEDIFYEHSPSEIYEDLLECDETWIEDLSRDEVEAVILQWKHNHGYLQ